MKEDCSLQLGVDNEAVLVFHSRLTEMVLTLTDRPGDDEVEAQSWMGQGLYNRNMGVSELSVTLLVHNLSWQNKKSTLYSIYDCNHLYTISANAEH